MTPEHATTRRSEVQILPPPLFRTRRTGASAACRRLPATAVFGSQLENMGGHGGNQVGNDVGRLVLL